MSNSVVGNVYDRIIKEVVDTSRLDFEESGIDDSVLEELRSVSRFVSRVQLSIPFALHPKWRDFSLLATIASTRIQVATNNPSRLPCGESLQLGDAMRLGIWRGWEGIAENGGRGASRQYLGLLSRHFPSR